MRDFSMRDLGYLSCNLEVPFSNLVQNNHYRDVYRHMPSALSCKYRYITSNYAMAASFHMLQCHLTAGHYIV